MITQIGEEGTSKIRGVEIEWRIWIYIYTCITCVKAFPYATESSRKLERKALGSIPLKTKATIENTFQRSLQEKYFALDVNLHHSTLIHLTPRMDVPGCLRVCKQGAIEVKGSYQMQFIFFFSGLINIKTHADWIPQVCIPRNLGSNGTFCGLQS